MALIERLARSAAAGPDSHGNGCGEMNRRAKIKPLPVGGERPDEMGNLNAYTTHQRR
jgi:hypothetical protein